MKLGDGKATLVTFMVTSRMTSRMTSVRDGDDCDDVAHVLVRRSYVSYQ